ncbi:hypothetical protein [Streptomyces sp. CA-179760]|uniref:hypothetical protein n=1 Tax=Streptomyces sp. CA-179760 TaxID=3240054 RepID=UPI003D89C4B0
MPIIVPERWSPTLPGLADLGHVLALDPACTVEEARSDVEQIRELDSGALDRLSDTDRAVLGPFLAG